MRFDSLAELWAMDGHGVFVWSVYAIATVILLALLWAPAQRKRQFFKQQAMLLRRKQGSPPQNQVE